MVANSMILIQEKATLMASALPQVSAAEGMGPSDTSQAFNLSFKTVTRLTLPVAESTWVPHAVSLATSCDGKERGATDGTPHSATSTSM